MEAAGTVAGRNPTRLGEVLNELLARRGYAQVQAGDRLAEVWNEAAGPELAALAQPGGIQRGVLNVATTNTLAVQELQIRQAELVARLTELAPELGVRAIKAKRARRPSTKRR